MHTATRRGRSSGATLSKTSRTVPARLVIGIAGLAGATALLSGCTGGSSGATGQVANIPTTGAASPAAQSNTSGRPSKDQVRAAALNYAKCMRSHGVSAFPDPDANGNLAVDGNAVGINSPTYKSADTACKSLMPAGPPPNADSGGNRTDGLKYSKCMRANGVPNFPDPDANGGMDLDIGKLGVDPNGPVFTKADHTCHKFLGNTQDSGSNGGSGA
jgi:hypothetical protein